MDFDILEKLQQYTKIEF